MPITHPARLIQLARAVLIAPVMLAWGLAGAQTTPGGKPIRLIVPYAAGGPIDVTARFLAERVKDSLGTVIIENRPGASTKPRAFTRAARDTAG